TPVTKAPARAAGMALLPVPHAMSRRREPGLISVRPINSSPIFVLYLAIWPKSPAIQLAFILDFNCAKSGDTGCMQSPRSKYSAMIRDGFEDGRAPFRAEFTGLCGSPPAALEKIREMYNVLVMRMVLDIFAQIFRNLWVHKL